MGKDDKPNNSEPVTSEVQPLQDLYELMKDEGLDVLELKDESGHVRLVRAGSVRSAPVFHPQASARASVGQAPASGIPIPAATTEKRPAITTPLAGVFYRASSPATPPFVKEGDVVDPGQTLCIVEAMKVMNEIKAETRCRIVKIVVENSRPVTAGQSLFLFEPA